MTNVLRGASILALLQAVAHALLFLSASPRHGAEEIAVIEAMKSHHFAFGGFLRSYWDFYFGYGLLAAFSVFVEAALLWLLATLAADVGQRIRPVLAVLALAKIAHALLCLKFFFVTPVVPDVAIAACLVWALLAPGPRSG